MIRLTMMMNDLIYVDTNSVAQAIKKEHLKHIDSIKSTLILIKYQIIL